MTRKTHVFVSGCYDILHAGHLQFFSEARALGEAARHYKVMTQMGNQGSAESGLRRAVEVVRGVP